MPTTKTRTKKAAQRATRKVTKKARSAPKAVRKTTRKAARSGAKVAGKKRVTPTPRSAASRNSSRDAIAELKRDHREVEQLFKRFEKTGDHAYRTKREIVDSIIEQLSRHAEIEELVMYPAIRQEVNRAEDDVLEALEEHHSVKVTLQELEHLDPSHERFDAKLTVLIEHVRHHVTEEEQQLFPKVRKVFGRHRLLELGDDLRKARPHVPSRPHPASPDEPPANALIGGAVAVMDRARSVGQRVVGHVRDE